MQAIGVTLWQNARLDLEKQQSLVRIQLCQVLVGFDTSNVAAAAKADMCGDLKDDIIDASTGSLAAAKVNDAVQCSSYGFGPGTRSCDGTQSTDTKVDNTQIGATKSKTTTFATEGNFSLID